MYLISNKCTCDLWLQLHWPYEEMRGTNKMSKVVRFYQKITVNVRIQKQGTKWGSYEHNTLHGVNEVFKFRLLHSRLGWPKCDFKGSECQVVPRKKLSFFDVKIIFERCKLTGWNFRLLPELDVYNIEQKYWNDFLSENLRIVSTGTCQVPKPELFLAHCSGKLIWLP